jgi:hypothetical protein
MAIPLEDSRNRQIRAAATWRTLLRNQEARMQALMNKLRAGSSNLRTVAVRSQAASASFSHFCMKAVIADAAIFFSIDWSLQVAC